MPIYEFVCGECGHEFEKILSFSATAAPACANCGADNVTRQMGRPAIHFKGSGWYINDSKKGNAKKGNNSSASAVNGDGDGVENGTESSQTDSGSSGESGGSEKSESKTAAGKDTASSKETTSSPAKTETS